MSKWLNRPGTESKNGFAGALWGIAATLATAVGVLGALPALAHSRGGGQPEVAVDAYDFNIPAQGRLSALADFTAVTGLSLIRPADDAITGRSPAVRGRMSARQALRKLLQGSGLNPVPQSDGSMLLEAQAGAGTAPTNAVQLAPLRVTADRYRDWVYQAPRGVSVISKEQMERLPARHAAELLQETPGVASAVSRQNPGLSVNIRGMQDFGRVNMMIDGMRQNFVQNGHQQRNGQMYVDAELLSGAVIEKGPRSNVHGAGAIAGQADFHTLEADDLLKPGASIGGRLRGSGGLGGEGNGVHFIGSAAMAGKAKGWEVVAAHSRRSTGSYDIGTHNSHGLDKAWTSTGYDGNYGMVKFADQRQNSDLLKLKYNFSSEESLKFTYTGTELDYANTSDASNSLRASGTPWSKLGQSQVHADNYSLDYSLDPADSHWINLKAKLYYVQTRSDSETEATAMAGGQLGSSQPAFQGASHDKLKMRTYGLQLDNTSSWSLTKNTLFSANYGAEYYQDRANSQETNVAGLGSEGDSLNPNGKRQLASLFTNLTLDSDLYTLAAGIRYDRYWLKGKTRLPGSRMQSRYEKLRNYSCNPVNAQRYLDYECSQAEQYGEQWLMDNYDQYQSSPWYQPALVADSSDYRVDESKGRFSPTLSAAIRPLHWLELYVDWGRAWRPPSINETLMYGNHPGDSFATMYPNPFAQPETTKTWEAGTNIRFRNLFKDGDSLYSKVGYFSTHADNYLFSSLDVALPWQSAGALTQMAYLNNRTQMHFSGIELEGRYDGDWLYGGLTFTHYLGGQNDFCRDVWPYGRVSADGSGARGRQECGNTAYNSSIAKPVDKGTINLGTRLFNHRLDTGLRYNYSGRGSYNQSSGGSQVWHIYRTLDWYGSFALTPNLKLLAAIENITDQAYRDGYSDVFARTWAPGRTSTLGMEVTF